MAPFQVFPEIDFFFEQGDFFEGGRRGIAVIPEGGI